MPAPLPLPGRTLILRHGETVFNAARQLQGDAVHTPLTRAGFAQMDAIGRALRERLGERPPLTVWTSGAGRARQSWAVMADHLGLDWFDARVDDRLGEIDVGEWRGLPYDELAARGDRLDPALGWFARPAPGGESMADVARRLTAWVADASGDGAGGGAAEGEKAAGGGDRLVVMHGLSSRVLRGLLLGAPVPAGQDAPLAPALPQGSVAEVSGGVETVPVRGTGGRHA